MSSFEFERDSNLSSAGVTTKNVQASDWAKRQFVERWRAVIEFVERLRASVNQICITLARARRQRVVISNINPVDFNHDCSTTNIWGVCSNIQAVFYGARTCG